MTRAASEFINEAFEAARVSPEQLDLALECGWRHFGSYFFRYERSLGPEGWLHVLPLRLELPTFKRSPSQRRIWRRNGDLEVRVAPAFVDAEAEALFARHKRRFKDNVPQSIYTFMSRDPARLPCENHRISLYHQGRLVAAHFLDIGGQAASSVNSFFDPDLSERSLGTLTILLAMDHAQRLGKRLYYPGYAHRENSVYDYKKRLGKLFYFDWHGHWLPLETS